MEYDLDNTTGTDTATHVLQRTLSRYWKTSLDLHASVFFTIQVIYTPITRFFESDLRDVAVPNHCGKQLLRTAPITSLMTLKLNTKTCEGTQRIVS